MKQRSLRRETTPRTQFPPCSRAFLKDSYDPKPCSHGRRDARRNEFKKFYKQQKSKDREIGFEINRLWREFLDEREYIRRSGTTPDEETVKYVGQLAKQIKDLTEQPRFRKEFPSFAAFYRFVRKEGVTLQDIREE
jgi:hypothetical protein